jgi:hypothetical protein
MCSRRSPPAYQHPTTRSAVTNGSRIHVGVDHRSASARRYRDLIAAFEAEIGGTLTEAERGLVRQAATLTLRAEKLAADVVLGLPVDDDLLIRLSGAARRVLAGVTAKADGRTPAGPTLAEYAALRNAERDGLDEPL